MYSQQVTGTQYVPVRTNHALHLVLSFLTLGLWLPVWVLMCIINANRVKALTTTSHLVAHAEPTLAQVDSACNYDMRPEAYKDGYRWCTRHAQWHVVSPVQS